MSRARRVRKGSSPNRDEPFCFPGGTPGRPTRTQGRLKGLAALHTVDYIERPFDVARKRSHLAFDYARPSPTMHYQLTVNGREVSVDVPPDMPLLFVLREVLDLPGTKFGCGVGQCGACTIHLGGQPMRSCQLPVSAAAGAAITTIEGLSDTGTHPVQLAWQEIDVPQCGYCQAGQIMSAAALLSRTPDPSDADIDGFMNGNICRCGTYLRIRKAIHRAADLAAGRAMLPVN